MAKHSAHPTTPGPCPRNRLTIDETFQRFLRSFEQEVETARQHLEAELCRTIRLWYGDAVIKREFFENNLTVHCETAADHRPTAELWVTNFLDLDGVSDWTVARADVEAFIKRHREANRAGGGARRHRMPPGPRPARNWQEHVLGEIVRAFTAGRRRPSGPELAQSCQDRLGHAPDVSAINGLIRDVLRGG